MNANSTKPGIKAQLEWMSRIGSGGFQNFDGGTGSIPRIVTPVVYESPEWKDAFRFAMSTAARLGLEGARATSAGWSETAAALSARRFLLGVFNRSNHPLSTKREKNQQRKLVNINHGNGG